MVRPYSPHCPNCAAPLTFDAGAAAIDCSYCSATLILDPGRVTHERGSRATSAEPPPSAQPGGPEPSESAPSPAILQPDPSLSVRDGHRFSMRILEQRAEGAQKGKQQGKQKGSLFESVELEGDRFAVVSLRCVGSGGELMLEAPDLTPAWEALVESLGDDGDPGLAVNLALEELAQDPLFAKLEAVVVVLDPERGTALVYCAGAREVFWLSTEEARPIFAGPSHSALSKADLAKRGNQFENGKELCLAASDLIVLTSFAFLDDPALGRGGARILVQTLRENLAESPERVVTLTKNAFWEARERNRKSGEPLGGDIVVAAVGARLPEPSGAAPSAESIRSFDLPNFNVSIAAPAGDYVETWPLQGGRHAFLWYSGPRSSGVEPTGESKAEGPAQEAGHEAGHGAGQVLREGVHAILDNEGHGYFDNAREAGRAGLEAIGGLPEGASLLVVHLACSSSSRGGTHGRIKYFARGCHPGLALGARGLRPSHDHQQFDEGGELSLEEHGRVLFPGRLPLSGPAPTAEELARAWYGGKASHLYESLRVHWRTRKGQKALAKIMAAADSDLVAGQGTEMKSGPAPSLGPSLASALALITATD